MARTYDLEWLIADAVKAYLAAQIDAETQEDCPLVTFYDPMAQDTANRFVVMVESGQGLPEMPGSYLFDVTVTVKSLWTEPSLSENSSEHRARTSELRDKLMAASGTLAESLNTAAANTLAIDFVLPGRRFGMDINDQYLLSETGFSIRCHSIT